MLFVFDENFSPAMAEGLAYLEEANKRSPNPVAVTHAIKLMGRRGAKDEEIIAKAEKQQAIILTKDRDFKHIKHYYGLYREHEVGVVFFRSTKAAITYWETVVAVVNKWEELKAKLAGAAPPFAFELNLRGIQQMAF